LTQVGERGQGPRGMKEKTSVQKTSGNKDGQNGSKDSEIEHQQHDQARKLQQAASRNDKKAWVEAPTKMVCQDTQLKQV
jgi:hypothetical protein